MIRINLLPYREAAKKENVKRQIIVIALSFVGFLLIVGLYQFYLMTGVSRLEGEIKDKEARLAALTKIVADVERFKKDKRDLEQKLKVIDDLEQNRTTPVQNLNELAGLVPVRDVWLVQVVQKETNLQIEGTARDNSAVARFMQNLGRAGFIASVDLVAIKQVDISGQKLQNFQLSCVMKKGW